MKPEQPLTPIEAAEFASKECRPWFDLADSRIAFRGRQGNFGIEIRPVPQDRIPKHMPTSTHSILIEEFRQIGIRASRDNSVFVTGDKHMASNFSGAAGQVYAVFPIGRFYFSWHPEIKDLIGVAMELPDSEIHSLIPGYKTDGLSTALQSGHEIAISPASRKYLAVREDTLPAFLNALGEKQ
jgi:hypothetical protein